MKTNPLSSQGPPRGEAHSNSKLNEKKVRRMRALHLKGFGYDRLAKEFGVSKPTVQRVILRRTWAHVS